MKLIVLNLKLYLDGTKLNEYINNVKKLDDHIVICPSSIHIPYFLETNHKIGIQNIAPTNHKQQTGEVSANQAKNLGVSYAIIGHSERRTLFNETNEQINQKVIEAISNKLNVILCIGENQEEYNSNKTKEVLKNQLEKALKDIKEEVIIAYEPVYAIGSGNVPSNESIDENAKLIKNEVQKLTKKVPKVLYGGSVNNNTITELEKLKNIDGYLIGGASAKIDVLNETIEKIRRQKSTK